MAKKGSLKRRSGEPDSEALTGTLPRPFADTTKLSRGDNRVMPRAQADLSFPRRRSQVAFGARPGRRLPPHPLLAKPPFLGSLVDRLRRKPQGLIQKLRADPRVGFCIRRKERREVLFALKRAGFRGSARKKVWKRSYNSQWRC